MQCPFCRIEVQQWDKPRKSHLVVTRNSQDDHVHVHGDLENKELMRELLDAATLEANIVKQNQKLDRKEYVFANRQRIGDILVMTAGIRDFKNAFPDTRVNVITTAMHIWDHNKSIDPTLVPTESNTIKIGPSKLTNASNRLDWHFANAYRMSIEDALNIHIPQGESRPDIWFTEEEYYASRIIKEPYWIIVVGGEKGWGCKMYPLERWQEFINQNKDIIFYQLGAREDNYQKLIGDNVVDYVGKTQDHNTGIRDLFKLFLNAEGSIGLVSFHMHLSGALHKPCIVVAGAREPVSFTQYPGHQYLATDGCLPCAETACWHCNIDSCTDLVVNKEKVPKCVDIITPQDLTNALNRYYLGGRLKKDTASKKPKLKNIVKTPKPTIQEEKDKTLEQEGRFEFKFGNTNITFEDWKFIRESIEKYKVKRILEFGSGLSTILLNELTSVVSFETFEGVIKRMKAIDANYDIRLWDGKQSDIIDHFDLIFVDGPYTGKDREFSTKMASELADLVIVHDAMRKEEQMWQEKYIKDKFDGPIKGGTRCSLWIKQQKENMVQSNAVSPIIDSDKKFIKLVSTARGWGGAQRSVVEIMNMFLKDGHKVEFIPFRNRVSSREFQDCIKNDLHNLIVTENYDTLKEQCDVLIIYADDFVWEFPKQEFCDYFGVVNATRKVMIVNYRLGEIGKVDWTKKFDKFMFLNSTQEKELLKVLPNVKTKVLAPCTKLDMFFEVTPDYNTNVRIVRHSSQGDVKFARNFKEEIDAILNSRDDVEINLLPGPSFISETSRVKKYPRTADKSAIVDFLSKGNLFVYSLPIGYYDQGPKVILEAMASGLAVLADNWGGAKDRINPQCGWLCNSKSEYAQIIKNLTLEELQQKGQSAREHAKKEFIAENWIKEILT